MGLKYIQWYGHTMNCLSVLQLLEIWVFHFLAVMLLWTFLYKFLHGHIFSFLLSIYLGVWFLSHMVTLLNNLGNCQIVIQSDWIVLHSQQQFERVPLFHILTLLFSYYLIIVILAAWSGISPQFWFVFPCQLMMSDKKMGLPETATDSALGTVCLLGILYCVIGNPNTTESWNL